MQTWLQAVDLKIQQLGGFGVYRFLENLFHAFEALFEVLTYSDSTAAKNALGMLQRIRQISKVRIVISLRNKTMYININFIVNSLSTNPTKWSNIIRLLLSMNCFECV